MLGGVIELDEILRRVWQNGHGINRWEELKAELRAYFGEQIGEDIKERLQKIGRDRNGVEVDQDVRFPEYVDGWCSALDEAIAVAKGE